MKARVNELGATAPAHPEIAPAPRLFRSTSCAATSCTRSRTPRSLPADEAVGAREDDLHDDRGEARRQREAGRGRRCRRRLPAFAPPRRHARGAAARAQPERALLFHFQDVGDEVRMQGSHHKFTKLPMSATSTAPRCASACARQPAARRPRGARRRRRRYLLAGDSTRRLLRREGRRQRREGQPAAPPPGVAEDMRNRRTVRRRRHARRHDDVADDAQHSRPPPSPPPTPPPPPPPAPSRPPAYRRGGGGLPRRRSRAPPPPPRRRSPSRAAARTRRCGEPARVAAAPPMADGGMVRGGGCRPPPTNRIRTARGEPSTARPDTDEQPSKRLRGEE